MKKVQIKKCYPYDIKSYMNIHYYLQSLNLSYNKIKDISPLKNFINVSRLYLDGNKIVVLTSLKNLNRLEDLDLSCNQISDISPLKNLVNLKALDLSINEISQEQIDELKKALPNCLILSDYDE